MIVGFEPTRCFQQGPDMAPMSTNFIISTPFYSLGKATVRGQVSDCFQIAVISLNYTTKF